MLRCTIKTHDITCMHVQAAAKKQFTETYLPLTLKKLESAAALNDTKEGWIEGDKVIEFILWLSFHDK